MITTKSCAGYALYPHSGMEIFSSCFPRLVQDALDLPVCRAFVATATILPGVNPLELDVSPKSRCRTSTAVPIPEIDRSRPSSQQIYLTAHPVFTLPESLQSFLRTENTGLDGMDLQDVWPEFYFNEEQPSRKVFLRGISPLKVLPPEDDT